MHSFHVRRLITLGRSTSAIYEVSVSLDIQTSRCIMKNEIQTTMSSDGIPSKHRDIFDEPYYGFNKRLLCAIGLWPGQPLKQKCVRAFGLLIVSFIVMIGQVRAIVGGWGQLNFVVEGLVSVDLNILGVLKLINALAHAQEIRKLFDEIQKYWGKVRCLPQIKILEECGEKGRRWTLFYLLLVYVTVFCWIVIAFSPKIMDALAPLNYSRRRFDLFPVDFMIDPDVYFYPIAIFMSLGLAYQLLVTVAMDTLYMVIAQHVCAMFEILRYNLHNVLHNHKSSVLILKPNIHEDMHYHEIISCIKEHKFITKYIKRIESTCEWKLFALLGMNLLALTFTTHLVIVTHDENVTMYTVRYAFFSIAQVVHLFCNTLPSHWIMHSSSCISYSAYSCGWYMMSLRSRKLILLLIRASITPCNITAGKLYVMSVENFSAVLRTSLSYLAMLSSI